MELPFPENCKICLKVVNKGRVACLNYYWNTDEVRSSAYALHPRAGGIYDSETKQSEYLYRSVDFICGTLFDLRKYPVSRSDEDVKIGDHTGGESGI